MVKIQSHRCMYVFVFVCAFLDLEFLGGVLKSVTVQLAGGIITGARNQQNKIGKYENKPCNN